MSPIETCNHDPLLLSRTPSYNQRLQLAYLTSAESGSLRLGRLEQMAWALQHLSARRFAISVDTWTAVLTARMLVTLPSPR